jgi:hypothetical protein
VQLQVPGELGLGVQIPVPVGAVIAAPVMVTVKVIVGFPPLVPGVPVTVTVGWPLLTTTPPAVPVVVG